jgi:Crossover junction endodeoxyribonuclease RuvC.
MILAIDQSLTQTGVCLIGMDGEIYHTGVVKTTSKQYWFDRMLTIVSYLDFVYDLHCVEPIQIKTMVGIPVVNYVVLEDYAFAGSFKGFVLGELGGIIKYHFRERSCPNVFQIKPQHHKMFVARDGSADKKQVMKALASRFDFETKNDNIADAVSMGLLTCALIAHEEGTAQFLPYEKNLLTKVRMVINGERITKRKPRPAKRSGAKVATRSDEDDPFKPG